MYEELFDFSKLDDLRENYNHLYHQIREYLSTLNPDDHWALEVGYFKEPDGSAVSMIFRSMRRTNMLLSVQAERNGADYSFTSCQVDETN